MNIIEFPKNGDDAQTEESVVADWMRRIDERQQAENVRPPDVKDVVLERVGVIFDSLNEQYGDDVSQKYLRAIRGINELVEGTMSAYRQDQQAARDEVAQNLFGIISHIDFYMEHLPGEIIPFHQSDEQSSPE